MITVLGNPSSRGGSAPAPVLDMRLHPIVATTEGAVGTARIWGVPGNAAGLNMANLGGAANAGTWQRHRGRRSIRYDSTGAAFEGIETPFGLEPFITQPVTAGWRPPADEACHRFIFDVAFTAVTGGGDAARAGVGASLSTPGGATILTTGSGCCVAGYGGLLQYSIRPAPAAGVSLELDLGSIVSDPADFHRYEIRLLPPTSSVAARIQLWIDHVLRRQDSYDGPILLPTNLGGATANDWTGVMGNMSNPLTGPMHLAGFRIQTGPIPTF